MVRHARLWAASPVTGRHRAVRYGIQAGKRRDRTPVLAAPCSSMTRFRLTAQQRVYREPAIGETVRLGLGIGLYGCVGHVWSHREKGEGML
jgi:hypothetical protein